MNLLSSCVLIALMSPAFAFAARIYYTDQPVGAPGVIRSVSLDGTLPGVVRTISGTPDLRGIAWHQASGRIYYLDAAAFRIRSILPSGEDELDVVSTNPSLLGSDVEIDELHSKLYWTEHNPGTSGNGYIMRANLDGTGVESVVTTPPGLGASPYFLFVDHVESFIYWGVQEGSSSTAPTPFHRNTFDGTPDNSFLITTTTRTRDIQIDHSTEIAYWNDRQSGSILKRQLAESTNELVLSGLNAPHGIALDTAAKKIYWADTGQRNSGPTNTSARRVARCNFDGSDYENLTIPTGANEPWDLALDLRCPTYNDWKSRYFQTINPYGIASQDPDGDGLVNLVEYAFDGNPRLTSSKPLPTATDGGFQFARRRVSTVTYQVEVSNDLHVWHFNGDGSNQTWTIESSVSALDDEMDSVVVSPGPALNGQPRIFFRVRISSE